MPAWPVLARRWPIEAVLNLVEQGEDSGEHDAGEGEVVESSESV